MSLGYEALRSKVSRIQTGKRGNVISVAFMDESGKPILAPNKEYHSGLLIVPPVMTLEEWSDYELLFADEEALKKFG